MVNNIVNGKLLTRQNYNLGAYDTVDTSNADYDLITRNTGYGKIKNYQWSKISANRFQTSLPNAKGYLDNEITKIVFSSSFVGSTPSQVAANSSNNICAINSGKDFLIFVSSSYYSSNTVEQFLIDYGDIEFQYELATSYTDKVIKNQPLNTLDSNGSQWLRSEWEKGLNLCNLSLLINGSYAGNENPVNTYTVSGDTITITDRGSATYNRVSIPVKTEIGKTYTFKADVSTTTRLVISTYIGGTETVIVDNQSYDDEEITFTATDTTTWFLLYASLNQPCSWSNIMLNEGTHAYPYVPYYGEIAHGKLYQHNIAIYRDGDYYVTTAIYTKFSYPINTWDLMKQYMQQLQIACGNSRYSYLPITGAFKDATGIVVVWRLLYDNVPDPKGFYLQGITLTGTTKSGNIVNDTPTVEDFVCEVW